MENRPWTKSEFFAWSDGRRIVDLYELSKQLQCKQCCSLLDLRRTERETRYGLASILYVVCNCGVINDVHTGKTQNDGSQKTGASANPMYEINIKASINLLMYGAGASRILNFLALLDIPVPPPDDTSLIVPVIEEPNLLNNSLSDFIPPVSALPATTAAVLPPSDAAVPQTSQSQQTVFTVSQPNSDTESDPMLGNEEEENCLDDEGMEDKDDDDDYVPPSRFKPKGKAKAKHKIKVSPKKMSTLQGPKSVREKLREKLKKAEMVKKTTTKVPKIEIEASVDVTKREEEEDDDKQEFLDPDDVLSSSESEKDIRKGKKKKAESDESWHENSDETEEEPEPEESEEPEEPEEPKEPKEPGERGKRKRGRPASKKGKGPKRPRLSKGTIPRCNSCDKNFSCLRGLNLHMKRVHNDDPKEKEEVVTNAFYFCTSCEETFLNQSYAHKHMISTHNINLYGHHTPSSMVEMPLRDTVIIMDEGIVTLTGRKKWRLHCLLCNTRLKSKQMLKHLRVDAASRTVTCESVCPNGQQIHSSIHHNHYKTFRKQCDDFVCHECGSSFSNQKRFQAHIERGHVEDGRERIYRCESCLYTSNNKHFLKLHQVMTHHGQKEEAKTYVCEDCGKGFTSSGGMRHHRQSWHANKKQHKCRYCDKEFFTRGNLKKHIKVHSAVRRYTCTECGQGFKSAYNLKVHQRIHTGFKPYRCQWCDTAFAQKNSLNVHMKKHEMRLGSVAYTPIPRNVPLIDCYPLQSVTTHTDSSTHNQQSPNISPSHPSSPSQHLVDVS